MTRQDAIDTLTGIGKLLELKGENPFKIRAYVNAARLLGIMDETVFQKRAAAGTWEEIDGIGDAIAKKLAELQTTGRLGFYEQLKASVPAGLVEMLDIPSLGPKKIRALSDKLHILTVAELREACEKGSVAGLDGFGEKSQAKILEGISNRALYSQRHLWWDAKQVSDVIVAGLEKLPEVIRAAPAGSLRRGRETVGDLDFIVATAKPEPIVQWFVQLPGVKEVTAQGDTKASVRFDSGLQADLRLVPDDQFAFALHHFSGSKDHNVQMRQRALSMGLSLSEWGLVPLASRGEAKGHAGLSAPITDETGLYRELGLAYIPPELREAQGEIEMAEKNLIPDLVELSDIRGAFHNHTTMSRDAHGTLEQMARAAAALGWEYLGLADHSKSSMNGVSAERLLRQVEEIRAWNLAPPVPIHLFSGTECDILTDGSLDYPDDTLARLDYVVASVHNAFTQDETVMTARIIKAIENPYVTMLGHPTGRLLLKREPYAVNMEKIIDAAAANGVIIELNAQPSRLDMDWRWWRKASEKGVLCSINPDAHDPESLAYVAAGIMSARKGWLSARHVLNTRSLAEIKEYISK